MASIDKPMPRLFLQSNWSPPSHLINYSLQRRTANFISELKKIFIKRKVRNNMLPHQRKILSDLRHNKDFLVIQADKNLGPCIIERQQYIQRALRDHLLDRTTYQQLNNQEVTNKIHHLKQRFNILYIPYRL